MMPPYGLRAPASALRAPASALRASAGESAGEPTRAGRSH